MRTPEKNAPRLVPHELVKGLRLSKELPNTQIEKRAECERAYEPRRTDSYTTIQIVHGEDFVCLGYLICRRFHPEYSSSFTEYYIYTTIFSEAARLAGLDEETLKTAFELPEPKKIES
jgi:hypothetical protein